MLQFSKASFLPLDGDQEQVESSGDSCNEYYSECDCSCSSYSTEESIAAPPYSPVSYEEDDDNDNDNSHG